MALPVFGQPDARGTGRAGRRARGVGRDSSATGGAGSTTRASSPETSTSPSPPSPWPPTPFASGRASRTRMCATRAPPPRRSRRSTSSAADGPSSASARAAGLTLGPLGIERRKPLTTVGEMVAALRALFAGERVEHTGATFSLRDAHLDYARPDIEIILAGRGPKMTALGASAADGFNLSYIHKDLLGRPRPSSAGRCRRAGRSSSRTRR